MSPIEPKHIFVAVQWSKSGAFELVALPDAGPPVSVCPWAVDTAGLNSLKQLLKQQGEQCLIVGDGEKDLHLLRDLLDVSTYEVVNAAPRLRLASAQGSLLSFYGGNQRASSPRQDAESDARGIRMGWRGSQHPTTARNPYARDDVSLHILTYAKRFLHPGTRLVLEMLEVASFSRYTWEHGARLAELLERHVSGRGHGVIGDYAEWVGENRLALFYTAPAAEELVTHARGRQAKAVSFLDGLHDHRPAVTVQLSYCTYDGDDDGWDSQALLEVALGLRQSRCHLG